MANFLQGTYDRQSTLLEPIQFDSTNGVYPSFTYSSLGSGLASTNVSHSAISFIEAHVSILCSCRVGHRPPFSTPAPRTMATTTERPIMRVQVRTLTRGHRAIGGIQDMDRHDRYRTLDDAG